MAEFLTTSGVTFNLEQIITGSQEKLILISPYLRVNDRLKQLLEDRDRLKLDIRIIYGKSDLHPDEIKWLRTLTYVRTSYSKNLHAKCFLNESEALITSMNLYEFSQVNNEEMGILVKRDDDPKLYSDIRDNAEQLIRFSDEVRLEVELVPARKTKAETAKKKPAARKKSAAPKTAKGHCIRCGDDIPLNQERPLCDQHYRSWARYENPDYPEKVCHSCGKDNDSTYVKPFCRTCWRKHAA